MSIADDRFEDTDVDSWWDASKEEPATPPKLTWRQELWQECVTKPIRHIRDVLGDKMGKPTNQERLDLTLEHLKYLKTLLELMGNHSFKNELLQIIEKKIEKGDEVSDQNWNHITRALSELNGWGRYNVKDFYKLTKSDPLFAVEDVIRRMEVIFAKDLEGRMPEKPVVEKTAYRIVQKVMRSVH